MGSLDEAHHDRARRAIPGFLIAQAGDAAAAMQYIARHQPAAVIVPRRVTDDPLVWISEVRHAAPDTFIIVTGDEQDHTVLDAGADILLGAFDEPAVASALQIVCARDAALVVEPDPFLAGVMLRWLGTTFDARLVGTGWRAVEVIREDAPDAVLAELRLPDMDASELYAAIQRLSPALADRTLFMSAGFVADRAQQFLARVPGQSIEKPFDLHRLRSALTRLLS